MARPNNPDNRYSFTCRVTGEQVKTNPKQFADLAKRYDITPAELDTSYISRNGRKVITTAKMTPDEVVVAYGIHQNVANNLKCCNIKHKTSAPIAPVIPGLVQVNSEPVTAVVSESTEISAPDSEWSADSVDQIEQEEVEQVA